MVTSWKFWSAKQFKIACIMFLLLTPVSWPTFADYKKTNIYTVGVVPQFSANKISKIWNPILDMLEKETGLQLELHGSPDIPEFEKEFLAGRFDFAYMNPYHSTLAARSQGYIPLVKDVSRSLSGVIVVRIDSPVTDVSELEDQTIVFPAPNALGASLLTRSELSRLHNIHFMPRYVKNHDSVYLNVVLGQAVAGGGVMGSLQKQTETIRKQLRVLYKTNEVPTHPFTAHHRIPAEVRDKVTQALLKLGEDPEGRNLLQQVPIMQIGRASLNDYAMLKEMELDQYYVPPSR